MKTGDFKERNYDSILTQFSLNTEAYRIKIVQL